MTHVFTAIKYAIDFKGFFVSKTYNGLPLIGWTVRLNIGRAALFAMPM